MTRKQTVLDDENDGEEFILIRVPKTIDPATLNGTKIYLNRTDDRPNVIRSSSANDDDDNDETYGYDFTAINNQLPFYSMNRIRPETSDNNVRYRMDRNTRLKGCLNFYKQPSPSLSIESNECQSSHPLESICPNDPVEMIVHRNKRKSSKQ